MGDGDGSSAPQGRDILLERRVGNEYVHFTTGSKPGRTVVRLLFRTGTVVRLLFSVHLMGFDRPALNCRVFPKIRIRNHYLGCKLSVDSPTMIVGFVLREVAAFERSVGSVVCFVFLIGDEDLL